MFRSKTWANNSTHLSSIATKPIVSIDRVLMHVPTLLVASATRTRNSLLILSWRILSTGRCPSRKEIISLATVKASLIYSRWRPWMEALHTRRISSTGPSPSSILTTWTTQSWSLLPRIMTWIKVMSWCRSQGLTLAYTDPRFAPFKTLLPTRKLFEGIDSRLSRISPSTTARWRRLASSRWTTRPEVKPVASLWAILLTLVLISAFAQRTVKGRHLVATNLSSQVSSITILTKASIASERTQITSRVLIYPTLSNKTCHSSLTSEKTARETTTISRIEHTS